MIIKPKHSLTSIADSIADGFQKGKISTTSAVYEYIVEIRKFIANKSRIIPKLDEAISKSDTPRSLLVLLLSEEFLEKEIIRLTTQILEITRATKSLNLFQNRKIRRLSESIDYKLVELWDIWHYIYKYHNK